MQYPPERCDSCSAPLQPARIYIGCIGQAHALFVCECCAYSAAREQYTLYIVATARLIIRQHQQRLQRQAVQL